MKACLALVLASWCAVAISPAIAGTQTGFVDTVYVRDSDGVIVVGITGNASGHPVCAQQTYWVIPNETTDSGKRLFSMLLAAQLSFRLVNIVGKNTCSRWPDGEDIDAIGLSNTQPS